MFDWLTLAQAVPLGGHAKHPHDCGEGRPLVVFHNDTRWSAYCHRCGPIGSKFKPLPTLHERLEQRQKEQAADAGVERDRRPPQPAVFDLAEWPTEARLWLYKAGLSVKEIAQLGAYWHPPTRRVVLPVFTKDLSISFWQARRIFGSNGAKYLSMPGGRDSCLPLFGTGSEVTLTEDLLSAFKIQTAGCMSLCLMGTSLLDHTLQWLVARPQLSINIWLDGDAAGMNAAAEVSRTLALFGRSVRVIRTDKDPKFHSKKEIACLLNPSTGVL